MEKAESLEQAASNFLLLNRPALLSCIYCGKFQLQMSRCAMPSGASWSHPDRCEAAPLGTAQGHTYSLTIPAGEDYELKRLVKFAAERERQVWAEAAKIVLNWSNNLCDEARSGPQSVVILTGPHKDTLSLRDETKEYASGLLANVYAVLRARGEQVK